MNDSNMAIIPSGGGRASLFDQLFDELHPVGDIVMRAVNVAPSRGTWVAWGAGRVPVGFNSAETEFNAAEKTGGAKTHTLTLAQAPAHAHGILEREVSSAGSGTNVRGVHITNSGFVTSGFFTQCQNAGGGGAHNNLQPYITCFMFKRIA